MARRISELFFELRAHTEGLKKDLDDSERQLGKWSTFVADHPTAVAGAIGAAILGIGIKATLMAEETDKALRRISASLPTAGEGVEGLATQMEHLAITSGRSLEEVQQAAVGIAKLGVASAEELGQQLEAATLLSDATGTSLADSGDLLIQLRREFHLTGEEALATAAKLASAAQGKASLEELIGAFRRASPVFQKYSIDAETGIRAIISLIANHGLAAKQVGSELSQLGGAEIRQLASEAKVGGDAMKQLADRAELVRGSASRAAQAARTELAAALEHLGTGVLPTVTDSMKFLADVIDRLTGNVRSSIPEWLAQARAVGSLVENLHANIKPGSGEAIQLSTSLSGLNTAARKGQFDASSLTAKDAELIRKAIEESVRLSAQYFSDHHNHVAMADADVQGLRDQYKALYGVLGQVEAKTTDVATAGGKSKPLPLSEPDKQKIAADLAEIQKAINEFSQSTGQSLAAGTKSGVDNALAELTAFGNKFLEVSAVLRSKIAALPPEASASVREQLQQSLEQLNAAVETGARERLAAIDRLAAQEAETIRATIGKELGQLTGNLAQQAGSAITQQNQQLREQILLSEKLSAADKIRLFDSVKLIELLQQQKNVAADAVRDVDRTIQSANLAGPTNKSFTEINAKAIELDGVLKEMVKDGGEQSKQGEGYKAIQDAILKLDKERADLLKKLLGIDKDVADSTARQLQTIAEQARTIRDAVDGALQLAGAFGIVDQNTVNILRSVGQIATQVPVLVSQLATLGKAGGGTLGSVIGAALPIAGGIATLVSSIIKSGGVDKEDAERARALADNTAAIRDLTKHAGLLGANIDITGGSAASVRSLLDDIIHGRVGQNEDRTGSATGHIGGLTQDQIDALNAAAKALGISIDGTLLGYEVLANALDQTTPLLGKFGNSVDDMLNEIDAEAKILGKSSPLDNLAGILDKLGTKSAGVASIFEGIDTSKALSADSIDLIRKRVQDLFKTIEGEGLSADQLGGLNGDEFLKLLEQIITDLDALGVSAQSAADKLKGALTSTQQDEQLHHVTDPVKLFQDKAADYSALGGALGDFLKQFDLTTPDGIAKMDAALGDFLDELKKNPDAFDLAGLSIDDFIAALLDLDASATSVANAIETAAQKMADAESSLSTSDAILGTTPTEQAQEKGNLYGFDLGDLSTQAGVDAAIASLQGTFKGLDPASADYKEKSREILNTIQALRGIKFDTTPAPAAGSSASAASSGSGETTAIANAAGALTEVTGNRMAEYLATILQVNRDELKAMQLLVRGLTTPIITGPILPPILPSWFGSPGASATPPAPTQTQSTGGAAAAIAGPVYNFHYDLHFDGGTFLIDKKDMSQLAAALLVPLSKGLFDQLRASQRLQGDTSIPTS